MRLFIGNFVKIPNYQAIKNRFSFIQGKWVEKENLHLTFLFLGEVNTAAPLIKKLKEIIYTPATFTLEGGGFFGSPPKVLFAKVKESEEIFNFQKRIVQALEVESKNFHPHITLCRIKKAPFKRLVEGVRELRVVGEMEFKPQLIQSYLTPKGPIYRPIWEFQPERTF